jgi:AraC-like DNA-binding protein
MRHCGLLSDFEKDPVGAFYAGRSFIYYYPSAELCGFVAWGSPSLEDIRELERAFECELRPPSRRHVAIVDTRDVGSVDTAAFRELGRYVRARHRELGDWVRRLALVIAPEVTGATMAGFFGVVPPPYPVQTFLEPSAALAWLEVGHEDLFEQLASMRAGLTGTPTELVRLRALLDQHLEESTLAWAARRLGVSPRGLQRVLLDAGTSFRAERVHARIRKAKWLLSTSDMPLSDVALEVGCPSQQHFASLFRAQVGTTPSAWRQRASSSRT